MNKNNLSRLPCMAVFVSGVSLLKYEQDDRNNALHTALRAYFDEEWSDTNFRIEGD